MKEFLVEYSILKTYKANVLAEDAEEAESIVTSEGFKGGEEDNWEDEIQICDVLEILRPNHLKDLSIYLNYEEAEEDELIDILNEFLIDSGFED